jgi:hypothetical protein
MAPLFTLWGLAYYPVINYEYAIVSTSQGSATRAQDLRAFLNWAIRTGTAQLAQVNFQPLPSSVVTLSQAQIAKIKGLILLRFALVPAAIGRLILARSRRYAE